MTNQLIIIRGPSGSGKTTAAMKQATIFCFEADYFFMTNTKDYAFRQDLLKEAHAFCLGGVAKSMLMGDQRIVVSNTFTTLWEMQPYLDLAKKMDYTVTVYRTKGPWDVDELTKRNIHNVPREVIIKQINRFEDFPGEIELP